MIRKAIIASLATLSVLTGALWGVSYVPGPDEPKDFPPLVERGNFKLWGNLVLSHRPSLYTLNLKR